MGPPETSPEAQATAGVLLAGRRLRDNVGRRLRDEPHRARISRAWYQSPVVCRVAAALASGGHLQAHPWCYWEACSWSYLKHRPWSYLKAGGSRLRARPVFLKSHRGKRRRQWRLIRIVELRSAARSRDRLRVQLEGHHSTGQKRRRAPSQERGTHQREDECKTLHVEIPLVCLNVQQT
jgi:hypothetical protein